jgi:hypothetical protein
LRVPVTLKTAEGGRWVLPHIAALRGCGHDVVADDGRLRRALATSGVLVISSAFGFRLLEAHAPATGARWLGSDPHWSGGPPLRERSDALPSGSGMTDADFDMISSVVIEAVGSA